MLKQSQTQANLMGKRSSAGLSDKGLVRAANQDSYYVDPDGKFFIVADGMGGHAGGQEASHIATSVIRDCIETGWDTTIPSSALLRDALHKANESILQDQDEHPERADMGTTAVILLFRKGQTWRAHVGDSRLYRLRQGQCQQVTEDHTWVARALKSGDLSVEQAKIHPWRHVLSQCLGRRDLQQIDVESLELLSGDRWLLCSDGLTEEVSDEKIRATWQMNPSCRTAAVQLVNAAKSAGGSDNITVVVVQDEPVVDVLSSDSLTQDEIETVDLSS